MEANQTMKKIKVMMTGFAFFAAVLMLTTTCIARPVQEKTNIEVFEYAEKELTNSLEVLNIKLSKDFEANILLNSIARDPDVVLIANRIGRARSEEEILSGIEQLVGVLQGNSEFEQLVNIVEEDYSAETKAISTELELMGYNIFIFDIIIVLIGLIIDLIMTVIKIILNLGILFDRIQQLIDFLTEFWNAINGGGGTNQNLVETDCTEIGTQILVYK